MELPHDVSSALAEGRQAYVAVETANGPHVTPELYVWSDGSLWFAAATTTLKARTLPTSRSAAAVVRLAGRDVMLVGPVDVFDVRRPLELARASRRIPDAVAATARFAIRNAHDLVAFAGDALTGKLGRRLQPARVFFRLEPTRAALAKDDTIVGSWGWGNSNDGDEDDVPVGGEAAVVAFPGPIALPARWFASEGRIFIPPGILGLADVGERSLVALATDEYGAPGPAAKTGTLQRGVAVRSDEAGYLDVEFDDVVGWDGVEITRVDEQKDSSTSPTGRD